MTLTLAANDQSEDETRQKLIEILADFSRAGWEATPTHKKIANTRGDLLTAIAITSLSTSIFSAIVQVLRIHLDGRKKYTVSIRLGERTVTCGPVSKEEALDYLKANNADDATITMEIL